MLIGTAGGGHSKASEQLAQLAIAIGYRLHRNGLANRCGFLSSGLPDSWPDSPVGQRPESDAMNGGHGVAMWSSQPWPTSKNPYQSVGRLNTRRRAKVDPSQAGGLLPTSSHLRCVALIRMDFTTSAARPRWRKGSRTPQTGRRYSSASRSGESGISKVGRIGWCTIF